MDLYNEHLYNNNVIAKINSQRLRYLGHIMQWSGVQFGRLCQKWGMSKNESEEMEKWLNSILKKWFKQSGGCIRLY